MQVKARGVVGQERKGSLLSVILQKGLLLALERDRKLSHVAHGLN